MGEAFRVGIDVGGTNTDAVAIDADGMVRSRSKEPTTEDPNDGILAALDAVAMGHDVDRVALGTTHALNAIVQRRGLRRVAVLRIGSPGTLAIPPCTAWPVDLAAAAVGPILVARGGVEVDGRIHPLDAEEIGRFAASLDADADAIAIVGTFSPLDAAQELEAAAIVASMSDLPCSMGHRIGGLGLLQRENATVLNAALGDVMERVVDGLETAVARLGAHVRPFLTQNDGTLMVPSVARDAPILTIGSGPSNSLRGAAALTGRADLLVADVGGTSTDVGALTRGFPRESAAGVTIGGVRTNFRMPDLVSVAVGGGTTIVDGALTSASVGDGSVTMRWCSADRPRRSRTRPSRPAGWRSGTWRVWPAATTSSQRSVEPRRWSPTPSTGCACRATRSTSRWSAVAPCCCPMRSLACARSCAPSTRTSPTRSARRSRRWRARPS